MSNRSQTAPCLLQEINNFDPRPEPDAFLEKPTSVAGHVNCGHVWLTNPDRTRVPNGSERPGKDTWYRIAATCLKCRSHIDLVLIYDEQCPDPCPTNGHPYHHFTHIPITSKDPEKSGLFQFVCSSSTCQALLILHFQRPVLTIVDLSHFSNVWAIKARLQEARKVYPALPERGPAEVLRVFRMTVTNCLSGAERRDINASNSIFMAVFGPETDKLLRRLGFQHIPGSMEQTKGLGHWRPPAPDQHPADDPAHNEERAFLEDVRDEINILISKLPPSELAKLSAPAPEFDHAQNDFARILGIDLSKPVLVRGQERHLLPNAPPYHQPNQQIYRALGIVPNFPTAHIQWAHDQQVLADPENEEEYDNAWAEIAVNTGDEDMQAQIIMIKEAKSKMTIDEAHRVLGIDPRHASQLQDEHIISAYHNLQDASESVASQRRKAMNTIGEARGSEAITRVADAMTIEQAYTYLGVDAIAEDDSIIAAAAAKRADSEKNAAKTLEAVQVITEFRNSDVLRMHLVGDDTPPKMNPKRAHTLFGIDIGASYDTQQLITTFELNSQDRPELREALEVLSVDRNDQTLKEYLRGLQSSTGTKSASNSLEEPRGLNNIGNTCYLASLLQYLYTLKVVRQIVGSIDDYAQPLGSEGTPLRKKVELENVTRTQVRRALQFVAELDKLFTTLASTRDRVVRPEVALARLTLERTSHEAGQAGRRSTLNRRPSNLPQLDGQAHNQESSNDSAIDVVESPLETVKEDIAMQDASNSMSPNRVDVLDGQASNKNEENSSSQSTSSLAQGPPNLPPRPQMSTDTAARSTKVVQEVEEWARQQDVREVMQRVITQLRWAIRGDGTEENGEQIDPISRLFWGHEQSVFIRHSLQEDRPKDQLQPFHSIETYLQQPCDIYGLLDSKYDRDAIEAAESIAQYQEITELPPILSITVERGVNYMTKSDEPLKLPEYIYMDRYMAGDAMLEKRRQVWRTKEYLRELKKEREQISKTSNDLNIAQTLDMTAEYLQDISNNATEYDLDASMIDEDLLTALRSNATEAKKKIDGINAAIAEKEELLERQHTTLFAEDKQFPYRIHAVLMHRSHEARVSSGHWFANIYDDKGKVWRRYNDEDVVQIKDPKPFLDPTKEDARIEGTSVFVVYVRADMADELVETVYRKPSPEMTQKAETQNGGFDGKVAEVPGVKW